MRMHEQVAAAVLSSSGYASSTIYPAIFSFKRIIGMQLFCCMHSCESTLQHMTEADRGMA